MAKVVVIDDRVTNRNILTRLALSVEEGLQVQAYASPIDALAKLHSGNHADLIITDYNMPEMDGATFIETLRESPDYADVPIIVITVYEDRDFCYRALEAGATDFLLSPVDHLEFRARARNLLTMRRQQCLLLERAVELENALHERGVIFDHGQGDQSPILNELPVAVSMVDRHGRFVFANDAHDRLFQVDGQAIIGKTVLNAMGEAYATRHSVLNDKVIESGQALPDACREQFNDRVDRRDIVSIKGPFAVRDNGETGIVTISIDLTDQLGQSEKSGEQGLDRITGLATGDSFRTRVDLEIARARRQNEMLAVMVVDIDRFKGINDAFGKPFADQLLHGVASRLQERLRETDSIARWRSDEFTVLQLGIKRPDDSAELCRRLNETFADPFIIDGNEVHISASIGITLFPADGRNADTLLKNADLAMYRAKASGRDGYRFFAAEMNIAARRAVTLERELRQALAGEQFIVYYQPQIEIDTGEIIGVEALVRWNHPHRGIVRPGEFIGLAEDIGLIAPLTAWVLRSSCDRMRGWLNRYPTMQLSVNLSPVQFRERGIELLVERILRETGVPPKSLDIELTENAVIENSQTASASLRYLNQLGVSLSIDDFGTGYSSLAYVKRLPVQRLKIDQSFVQAIENSSSDEVIVRAIINLGHSLGLKVIAEGVETIEQLKRLQTLGCDQIQGDFISPPIAADIFDTWAKAGGALRPDGPLRENSDLFNADRDRRIG